MYLRVTLLVVFSLLSGVWALTPNDWKYSIIRSYAEWTRAANTKNSSLFLSLHSEQLTDMIPGRPILMGDEGNADFILLSITTPISEYQQLIQEYMASNRYPAWLYLGFEELLYSGENAALASHIFFQEDRDGKWRTGKGVRWFQIEDGKAKIALSIYNYNDVTQGQK